jgi:catechol 2,3-dioxygenase-like lactoylglutathione lyase family enzyme
VKLTHSCIITENVQRLNNFYKEVLQIEPQAYGDDYVEFPTDCGVLSIFSFKAQEELAKGSTKPESNRCLELEFDVDNVDNEFIRLQQIGVDIVKPLTTQQWGNRSFYFRDPDGNLINFYTRTR